MKFYKKKSLLKCIRIYVKIFLKEPPNKAK